jgi:hypothetical protein
MSETGPTDNEGPDYLAQWTMRVRLSRTAGQAQSRFYAAERGKEGRVYRSRFKKSDDFLIPLYSRLHYPSKAELFSNFVSTTIHLGIRPHLKGNRVTKRVGPIRLLKRPNWMRIPRLVDRPSMGKIYMETDSIRCN